MKNKNIIIYILLSIILTLTILYLHERQYRSLFWSMVSDYHRLSEYQYFRSGKELIYYYGLPKDSVMKMLPEPTDDSVFKLDSSMCVDDPWFYRHIAATYLKSKYDTIEINSVDFRIPYHEIPNLHLIFIKKDSVWVVEHGVQWNDDTYRNSRPIVPIFL
jgi:hypothetical protein